MTYLDKYGKLELRQGAGGSYENGLCFMEAAAWLGGEEATDAPQCACPVLGRFGIRLNDALNHENRQKLLPLSLNMVGSRSKEHERIRADYLVIQVARRILPIAFDAIGQTDIANEYRQATTKGQVYDISVRAKKSAAAYAAYAAYAAAADAYAAAYAAYAAYAAAADAYAAAAAAADAYAAAAAAAAADAYAAAAAAADAYAAYAAAHQDVLLQCIPILAEAIDLGPNGKDALDTYLPRIEALGEFADKHLVGAE